MFFAAQCVRKQQKITIFDREQFFFASNESELMKFILKQFFISTICALFVELPFEVLLWWFWRSEQKKAIKKISLKSFIKKKILTIKNLSTKKMTEISEFQLNTTIQQLAQLMCELKWNTRHWIIIFFPLIKMFHAYLDTFVISSRVASIADVP